MIEQLNEKFIEFDFRNGKIRRKYDGLKYVSKKIQDIFYEIDLQNNTETENSEDRPNKRIKLESITLIDKADFDEIKLRMDEYDKLREEIIKQSRDVQKFSKQAIFSIHRKDLAGAKSKLAVCLTKAKSILNDLVKVIINKFNLFLSIFNKCY